MLLYFFFFQAEDGIRYYMVTGVQTCALPICSRRNTSTDQPSVTMWCIVTNNVDSERPPRTSSTRRSGPRPRSNGRRQIGRASCRERVKNKEEAGREKKKKIEKQEYNDNKKKP